MFRFLDREESIQIRKDFIHALHVKCGDPMIYEDATREIYFVLWGGMSYEQIREYYGLPPDSYKPSLRDALGPGGLSSLACSEELSTTRLFSNSWSLNYSEVITLVNGAATDVLQDFEAGL